MNNSITFPLSGCPTHYIARVEDAGKSDCAHIAIKLMPSTLIRLILAYVVASVLRLFKIKIVVFETRADTLSITYLRDTSGQCLEDDQETSSDDAPYDCLTLGELISLGGYATDRVLDAFFSSACVNVKMYAIEVYVERFAMWLKIYAFGWTFCIETEPFNLDIIVKDFLARNVPRTSNRGES